jgi:AraC-like DNA-binding protein
MQGVLELGLSIRRLEQAVDGPILVHLGMAFLHAYAAAARESRQARPAPEPVRRARRYIAEHFEQPLDLAAIASAAGVSENHVVRLFRRHLGQTPIRYLWRLRVERGVELLRDTGLSISEVAYRVGFSTPFHFSRLVKQQTGHAPKALRQRFWQER